MLTEVHLTMLNVQAVIIQLGLESLTDIQSVLVEIIQRSCFPVPKLLNCSLLPHSSVKKIQLL